MSQELLNVCSGDNDFEAAEKVKELLKNGEDSNYIEYDNDGFLYGPPLRLALRVENFRCAELLLEYGADVNFKCDADEIMEPLLHDEEILLFHKRSVEFLLSHGADPNIKDSNGHVALHFVNDIDDVGIVKILLSHGADPNIQNHEGNTPLHKAVFWENVNAVVLLLKFGSSVGIRNFDGFTPFELAERKGVDSAIIRVLKSNLNGSDETNIY